MFLFFFFAFGDVFYLRINASPQTLGFLFFLIALGIIPIANRSIWLRGLMLLDLAVIIILHPATPLLALPGLVVDAYVADEQRKGALRKTLAFIGTFLVGYVAWTMYRADWIFSHAVKTILSAFQEEKRVPIVDSPVIPQIEVYVALHRILLIALLLVLVLSFFATWRSKIWRFVTVWGIALIPAFLVLFSYKDFFDRVLLFVLLPCAIIFAEAWDRFRERFTSWTIRGAAVLLLVCLVLLSASVAYFSIGSVDRITQGEVDALEFLGGMPGPVRVYANGFNLPLSSNLRFVPVTRGSLNWEDIDHADAVVLSQQMINAVMLNPGPEHSLEELMVILERDFQEIYNNGEVRIFLRIQGRVS
jgi:hypothetical protein